MSFNDFLGRAFSLDREDRVTGYVLDFAFGPSAKSYFATFYPYRFEQATRQDIERRVIKKANLPRSLDEEIERFEGRFILHVSINKDQNWHLYYAGPSLKGDKSSMSLKEEMRYPWAEHKYDLKNEFGHISVFSYGETHSSYFIRATAIKNGGWYPRWGKGVPHDCDTALQKRLTEHRNDREDTVIRSCVFGYNQGWILYGKKWHTYGGSSLPRALKDALDEGQRNRWSINTVALNLWNPKEYVLVYNQGQIYCAFHEDFKDEFFQVARRWRDSMSRVTQDKAFVLVEPIFEHVPPETFELPADEPLPPLNHYRSTSTSEDTRERAGSHQSNQSLVIDSEPSSTGNGHQQGQPPTPNGAPAQVTTDTANARDSLRARWSRALNAFRGV